MHYTQVKYGLVVLLVLFSLESFSQSKRLEKANEIFEAGEYYRAIKPYKRAMKKLRSREERAKVYYKIGICYYNIGNYRRARTYLRRVPRYDEDNKDSYFLLADVYKLLDKYDLALEVYQDYKTKFSDDSIADLEIQSCELALKWLEEPTRFKVNDVRDFNTRENDFAPFIVEKDGFDHIYFSSNRKDVKGSKKSDITGQKFSDLFVSKMNRQKEWSEPVGLDSLNTDYDEGTPSLNSAGATMYYTSCQVVKNKKMGCHIYKASKSQGEFMNPEMMSLVSDSMSAGHPRISPDGETMFFAARKTGGFGNSDLWYCEKSEDGWGRARNMGLEINTPGEEMFPFIRADSTLFFASDRYPSMGGLDIFKAKKDSTGHWLVENMKPPFNSSGNDFGIYYYSNAEKGYFTSDRKGSKGEDIYYFEKPPLVFALEGEVQNMEEEALGGAIVRLIGSDGTMFTDTADQRDGYFDFDLKENTDYVFLVTHPGYFNGKGRLTTDTLKSDYIFERIVKMESTNQTFEIPNITYEFGKWKLTDEAKYSLDSLVSLLNDNPTLVIELASHTDMVGSDESNKELSEKRANSVVEYLSKNGIPKGRLQTVGYGESRPKEMAEDHPEYDWLREGDILDEEFINSLSEEQQEIANRLNRRTEFRVVATDYEPSLD